MSRLISARLASALLALLVLGTTPSMAAPEAPSPTVEYRNDKLTLRAHDAPVADILEAITRQSGAEIRGRAPQVANVTADFEAVPLTEALQRMLGENFTLRYGDDGTLKTIELKGGPEAPIKPVKTEKTADGMVPTELGSAPDTTPEVQRTLGRVFQGARRVPIDGRFAKLIDSQDANWDMVLNTAFAYEKDAKVRSEAVRAGLRALDDNPELRANLLGAVTKMDDKTLAEFALFRCKHMCEDLMKNVVRQTRDREIRGRAIAVLRQLRTMPRPAGPFAGM